MPIYEYRCTKCGEQFERLVRNSDDEKDVECRACGSKETERLLSMFAGGGGSGKSAGGASCAPQKGFS